MIFYQFKGYLQQNDLQKNIAIEGEDIKKVPRLA